MRGRRVKLLRRAARNTLHPTDEQPCGLEPVKVGGKPKRGTIIELTQEVTNLDGSNRDVVTPFEITPTLVNRPLSHRGLYRWLKNEAA